MACDDSSTESESEICVPESYCEPEYDLSVGIYKQTASDSAK